MLTLRLRSSVHPEYACENDEVHQVIGQIFAATNGRGIFVYDRGGDGDNMFTFYVDNGLDFIVRLVGDRDLLNWGGRTKASEVLAYRLAELCALRYEDSVLFKSEGKVKNVRVKYGSMPMRLPRAAGCGTAHGRREVAGRGQADDAPDYAQGGALAQGPVGGRAGLRTRWRAEETTRSIKTSYRLERMRMLKLRAAEEHGVPRRGGCVLRRRVDREEGEARSPGKPRVAPVSRKMFETPEFFYCAVADGIRWLFVQHGRWRGLDAHEERGDFQMEFDLMTG